MNTIQIVFFAFFPQRRFPDVKVYTITDLNVKLYFTNYINYLYSTILAVSLAFSSYLLFHFYLCYLVLPITFIPVFSSRTACKIYMVTMDDNEIGFYTE